MPEKTPDKSELNAARINKKRREIISKTRTESREIAGEWWVILVIRVEHIVIELPIAHVANEKIADDYAAKVGINMIDAIFDYLQKLEDKERS